MNLNKAMILGNLTREPETRTTPKGQAVSNFGVATNRVWRDQQSGEKKQSAEYHNVVAWGKLADICTQYLHKGSKVYIEGRLQTRSWDDPSGQKKYRTEIIAENMIMLDRKGDTPDAGTQATQADANENKPPVATPDEEISVEDIPF
ncbi:single-stranded DNA-binding protein [Patescibacteria group bacterium]|nr:single-stranded DNA-binding protein [Patescibacteria group bacterium]MBU1890591.1 single-stranded DNA-binding protein [Patescibacteria group bacterium]